MSTHLTTPQIMARLHINRARVSQLARRYGWRYEEIPSNRNIKAKRYLLVDVERTEAIRAERNLHDFVK